MIQLTPQEIEAALTPVLTAETYARLNAGELSREEREELRARIEWRLMFLQKVENLPEVHVLTMVGKYL